MKRIAKRTASIFLVMCLLLTFGASSLATVWAEDGDAPEILSPATQPSAPEGLLATVLGESSIRLNWDVVPGADSYVVYRGSTPEGPHDAVYTVPNGETGEHTDTGLAAGSSYYYTVTALQADVESPQAAVVSATTAAPVPGLPAPANFEAKTYTPTITQLKWTRVAGATGYTVYRSTEEEGTYEVIASGSSSTSTSCLDTKVVAGTTYYYKVIAYKLVNGAKQEGAEAGPLQWPEASGVTPPSAPATLSAVPRGANAIEVSWSAVNGASEYRLYRSSAAGGNYIQVYVGNATSYTNSGLSHSTQYFYKVKAFVGGVESAASDIKSATTLAAVPPAVPGSPLASAQGQNSVFVSWALVQGADGYKVYRASQEAPAGFALVYTDSTGTATGFTDTGLEANTTYYYRISALRNGAESDKTEAVDATTDAAPSRALVAPPVPTGLTATLFNTNVVLKWYQVVEAEGYILYRSTTPDGNYLAVATIDDNSTTSFTNTSTVPGETYYYRLSAVAGAEESAMSDYAAVTIKPGRPAGAMTVSAGETSLNISWTPVTNADSYNVYRTDSPLDTPTSSNIIYSGPLLSWKDSGLQIATDYYYWISAVANDVEGELAGPVRGTTDALSVPPPKTITATATSSNSIRVDWSTVAEADGYKLYWSLSPAPESFQLLETFTSGNTESYLHTGLLPNTTYYYMVSATHKGTESNKAGPASDTTWPEVPQRLEATATGPHTIDLKWEAVAGATGYEIFRSLTGAAGSFSSIDTVGAITSTTDSGLTANTLYYYQVRAVRNAVYSELSNIASDRTWPLAPEHIYARATGSFTMDVWWDAVPGATGYRLYRALAPDGPYTTPIATPATNSYGDTGLTPNTTYYYVVEAMFGTTPSTQTGPASDTTWPEPPLNLVAVATGKDRIQLNWNAAPLADGYLVYRARTMAGPWKMVIAIDSSMTELLDTGLLASTTYYYYVTAEYNFRESRPSNIAHDTTWGDLAAPQNLTATGTSTSNIHVTWDAVANATGYDIYRSETGVSGSFSKLTSVGTTTQYDNSGLPSATTYWYYVVATRGSSVSSDPSNIDDGTTWPEAPMNLVATAAGTDRIQLNWNAVPKADGYDIYRSPVLGGSYQKVGSTTGRTNVSHLDTGLQPETWYYYYVVAVYNGQSSTSSNVAYDKTWGDLAPPQNLTATGTSSSNIRVTWSAVANATGYDIYRSATGNSGTFTKLTSVGATTVYDNGGLSAATTYWYYVVATRGATVSTPSNIDDGTTWPEAPTSLAAVATGTDRIQLNWTAVSKADGYDIYRASSIGGTYSYIGSTYSRTTTSYLNTGLNADTYYYYYVKATYNGQQSAQSNIAYDKTWPLLTAPVNLRITSTSYRSQALAWNAVTGATSYKVYRSSPNSSTNITYLTTVTGTSYTSSELWHYTGYYYYVTAIRGTEESSKSNTAYGTTSRIVLNVTVSQISGNYNSLSVNWSPPSGVTLPTTVVSNYRLVRGGTTVNAATNTKPYTDTGLTSGTAYSYTVTANQNSTSPYKGEPVISGTGSNTVPTRPGPNPPDFWFKESTQQETTIYFSWRTLETPQPHLWYHWWISTSQNGPYERYFSQRYNQAGATLGELYTTIYYPPSPITNTTRDGYIVYFPKSKFVEGQTYYIKMSCTNAAEQESVLSSSWIRIKPGFNMTSAANTPPVPGYHKNPTTATWKPAGGFLGVYGYTPSANGG